MNIRSCLCFSLLIFTGCSESVNDELYSENSVERYSSNVEKAITSATRELQAMHQVNRKKMDYSVKSVYPILSKKCIKRSSDADTLLYLINYKDGFAIVGAQNYTDQVFAISDKNQIQITDTLSNPILSRLIQTYANYVYDDALERDLVSALPQTVVNVLEYMPPLVQAKWGQQSPFCAYYTDGSGKAGCAPIAVGQICYYYKKPQNFNGYQFDWNTMQNIKTYLDFNTNKVAGEQVSRFLFEIAKKMGTNNGSTSSTNITPCLTAIGYSAAMSNLEINTIKWEVLNSSPSLIGAVSSAGIGHIWVVDGYRETETKILQSNGYDYDYQYDYYLHCNWGWNGNANGYYRYADSQGLLKFDTTAGAAWGGDGTTGSSVYVNGFKMVVITNIP